MSRKRRLLFGLVTSVLALLALEGLCGVCWLAADYSKHRASLPRAARFKEESHARHDAELGWIHVAGTSLPDFYGPGRDLRIGPDGFRTNGPDDPRDEAAKRVVCLGDSFTLGYGVDDRETWPAHLERQSPEIRTVNMGQGGYSVGQCALWFRRSAPTQKIDAIVFAFIIDDVWRMGGTRMAKWRHYNEAGNRLVAEKVWKALRPSLQIRDADETDH